MPALHVQETSAKTFAPGASFPAAAFGGSVVTGNLIAVAVAWANTTQTLTSVTDSQGNTYTLVNNPTNGTDTTARFAMAYALNVTGGASFVVTANFSGDPGAWCSIAAHEASGVMTSSAFDGSAVQFDVNVPDGTANALNSTAITTTVDGDYIFAAAAAEGLAWGATISAGTGYTLEVDGGAAGDYATASQIQTSAGSIEALFTQTGGTAFFDGWAGIMAFKPVAAAATKPMFRGS
jgi:hypothetical protein